MPFNTRISNRIKPCTVALKLLCDRRRRALDRALNESTRAKIQQKPAAVNSAERVGPSVLHLLHTDGGRGGFSPGLKSCLEAVRHAPGTSQVTEVPFLSLVPQYIPSHSSPLPLDLSPKH